MLLFFFPAFPLALNPRPIVRFAWTLSKLSVKHHRNKIQILNQQHDETRMVTRQQYCQTCIIRKWSYKQLGRVKQICYLSPMRAAKVQASLRIRAVTPEPPLLAHTSSESRRTFRQKARSLAPLNGWACAVKICLTECSKTQIRLTRHN